MAKIQENAEAELNHRKGPIKAGCAAQVKPYRKRCPVCGFPGHLNYLGGSAKGLKP